MRKVNNLADLKNELEKNLRNPYNRTLGVRLLFVNTFEDLRKLESELLRLGEKIEYAENYIPEGKNWLSVEEIINLVKKFLNENLVTFIFSLDNILRFYRTQDLKTLLGNLLRQRTNNGYVFLVLSGLKERVNDILEKHKEFSYEFFTEGGYIAKIYSLNPNLEININAISDVKEFLRIWRYENKEFFVKIPLIHRRYHKAFPDSAVEVTGIETYREFLKKVYNFRDQIAFSKPSFEKKLVELIKDKKINTFADLFPNISSFAEFVRNFLKEQDNFKIQLLLNFAYNTFPQYRHLLYENKTIFLKKLYNERNILSKEERKKIITIALKENPAYETNLCEELKNSTIQTNLGVLSCEKEQLLELFRKNELSSQELTELSEEFRAYLYTPHPVNLKSQQEWVYEYCKLYKESKLKDNVLSELEKLWEEKKKHYFDWYYSFDTIQTLVNKWKDKVQKTLWIDGLGFEWLGFFLYLLEKKGIKVNSFYIARSRTPSITEINKPDFKPTYEVRDFDKLLHERYTFPKTFIRQMEKLKEIVDKYIIPDEKVLIFSDHGSSALVRLKDPIKLSEPLEFQHGGRYFKGKLHYHLDEVIEAEQDGYYMAVGHKSVNTKPLGEVHGGGTPEEIFTFILITGEGNLEKIPYQVKLEKEILTKRDKHLKVKIEPKPDLVVKFYIDNKERQSIFKNGWFLLDLQKEKTGKHLLEVKIGSQTVSKQQFELKGGIEEVEDFLL